ncbi:Hsp20/alpha crystallin family protein [Patescibacteria group bacterium]
MFGKKDTNMENTDEITKIDPIPLGDEKPTPSAPPPTNPQPADPVAGDKKEDWLDKEEDFEGQLTLDVYQDADNIVIKSTIAGVKPEDLDISINNDMLIVKGERKKHDEVKDDDYFYQECYWGAFSRSVILPMEVEADKIDATLQDGILTIKLPKSKKAKARKIQVKAAS